jgi:hypothetical protein
MGCTRFQQIKQYLTIVDRGEGPHRSSCWYEPIKPLIEHLRKAFREYIIPGTHLAIDEAMAKFRGRSHDTTILPRKPIPEGFKVWLCAYQGYVYAFELHSGVASAERSKESRPIIPDQIFEEAFKSTNPTRSLPDKPRGGYQLAETQALVYRFAKGLPQGYSWVVYLDNLFVNQPLFALLRKDLGVAATGTTRKNARGIPKDLIDAQKEKHQWGSTIPRVVGNVLIGLWQDNAPLIFMTTAHSLKSPEDVVLINRKRPALNSTNRSILLPVFGDQHRKVLPIPRPIDDYNHHKCGGDTANQLRVTYDMQRRNRRTWRALFDFFLKTSIVNAYLLSTWGGLPPNEDPNGEDPLSPKNKAHRKFREDLIESLWLYAGNTGPTAPLAATHEWVKLATRYKQCIQCRAREGTRAKRKPLRELNTNTGKAPIPRTSWGCKQCEVALCNNGSCWQAFHRVE